MRSLATAVTIGLFLATPVLAQDRRPPKSRDMSWDDWPPELKKRFEEKLTAKDVYEQQWVSTTILPLLKVATDNWEKAAAGDYDAFDKARTALLSANKKMADARNEAPAWGPKIADGLKLHDWLDARTLELYRACEAGVLKRAAEQKPAPEVYEGPDREKLRTALRAKWTEAWPTDKVVAVRVEDDAWHRKVENRKLRNGSTEVIDQSTLVWRVYVAYTDKVALGYVVEAYRNNLDQTIEWGVWAKPSTGTYTFNDYPLANVSEAGGGLFSWKLALGCCCPLAVAGVAGVVVMLYLKKKAAAPGAPSAGGTPPPPPPPVPPAADAGGGSPPKVG